MQKRKSFMSNENERDANTSASTRKGKFLIIVLVLLLASRLFSGEISTLFALLLAPVLAL